MKNLIPALIALLLLTACQERRPNAVPADWIHSSNSDDESEPSEPPAALGETVDRIFTTQGESLEKAEQKSSFAPESVQPSNRWHMTAFLTDLSVSVGGLLGSLVYKGTPTVIAVFRKQYPKPDAMLAPQENLQDSAVPITSTMSSDYLERAIEPSLQASLATGRIKDEHLFRAEALRSVQEFQSMTRALELLDENLPWKVSRFRIDLSIDDSGKITPVITAGCELRLRLEWFRMKRPSTTTALVPTKAEPTELTQNLVQFASEMSDDLIELSDDSILQDSGFKAFTYRVGLGVSKKQQFGVVTDNRSLVAHLYFSRNVPKPIVNPKPPREGGGDELAMLDSENQVSAVTHRRFRKGLQRAMKMGAFFARYAARHPQAHWKIYELRTSFDLSLAGKTSLTGVSGLGATDISFYNQRF